MNDDYPNTSTAPRKGSTAPVTALFLGLLLGGAAVGALAWYGELDRFLPSRQQAAPQAVVAPPAQQSDPADLAAVGSVEARLALLEERFSRLGFQADAAAGNAARAEGLLIAFSARRLIDRGAPLGFVSDQLRLRFADAQPESVDKILRFAAAPVTIDQLGARLEALAPGLTDRIEREGLWDRVKREFNGLVTIHRDSSALLAPDARIARARLMLAAGRIDAAIEEVARLPGAGRADKWIADARRYEEVQRALDLIETTAMLEPRRLRDGAGQFVTDPSPLAPLIAPPPEPTPAPTATTAPIGETEPVVDASETAAAT